MLYLIVGTGAVWIGRSYAFGTGGRMGPGYFPTVLGTILMLLGFLSAARSLTRAGEPLGALPWRSLALVVGACVLFGLLLPRAGFPVALAVLVLVSAAASVRFRFEWTAALGLVGLTAFCTLVFVLGLRVPLPLVGTWFGG